MIFQLINEGEANWNDPSLVDAIDNILKSFSERKHIVLASSDFFDRVKESDKFSPKVRNTASIAKQYNRELRILIKQNYVNSYIRIDLTKDNCFQLLEENGKIVVKSGFGFFMNSSAIQNTFLIVEALIDAKFYIHIGNFYIKSHSTLNQCALSFCASNGGGNQTANVYKNNLRQNRLCYCIVDSDKKHPSPNSPKGETSKAFFKHYKDFKDTRFHQIGQVRILDVHEVESIIPMKILAKIFETNKQEKDKLKTIQRLEWMIDKNSDIRKYLDHKKGLTKHEAKELDKKYKEYYIPELNKLIVQNNKCFIHENEEQINCDDNCFSLAPMGDKLLHNALEILDKNDIGKGEIDNITLPYWETLGKEIFSWCCCFNASLKVS